MEVGLSLGSNLGNRISHLREAKRQLLAIPGVHLLVQSPLYETEPVDVQPDYKDMPFVNAVLILQVEQTPHETLGFCSQVEHDMGRIRGADKNAPRPIDIDILYAGDQLLESGALVVPHPRWADRRFVVQPLADVRPDLKMPGFQKSVQGVLAEIQDQGAIVQLPDDW